jgi:hypothetical protein
MKDVNVRKGVKGIGKKNSIMNLNLNLRQEDLILDHVQDLVKDLKHLELEKIQKFNILVMILNSSYNIFNN